MVSVRRDELARFETLPLFVRLPGASRFPSGQRLKVAVDHLDFLALEAHCHVLEAMDVQLPTEEEEEDAALPPENPVAPPLPVAAEVAPP